MLGKLPKLRWGKQPTKAADQPAQPARATAVATDNQQAIDTLRQDASAKKRLAACGQVKDTEVLLKVSRDDSDEQVRDAAARQYARTLPDNQDTKALLQEYAGSKENRHLGRLITALHANAEVRQLGLSLFSADEDYQCIAIETRFHDTRVEVCNKVTSLEVVDSIWRNIKTKDKVVARTLKQRLQEHQDNEARLAQQRAEIEKILEEMDRLANGAWSPNYISRFDLFVQRWDAIDFDIDSASKQRFESLKSVAGDKVEKNRQQQQLLDRLQTDIQQLEQSIDTLQQCSLAELAQTLSNFKPQLHSISARYSQPAELSVESSRQKALINALDHAHKALRQAEAADDIGSRINNSDAPDVDQLQSLQKALTRAIKSPEAEKAPTRYAAELPELLQSINQKLKQQTQANAELKSSIHKQFGSLNSAIAASKWGPATSIHERLARKIQKLPAHDRQALSDKLAGFEKRLTELGDWKQFATEPKLIALCEEMENLPSHQLSPKDQAERIKELQNQWKAMGANPAQQTYWPRFKAAADTAYAPCAEYFAKRRAEKQSRLSEREKILSMLQQYVDQVDWENPDSRLVEKTIRTAKSEWRKLRVFDRKATAAQEESFTQLLATLKDRLAPVYEQGIQEREALIQRVTALGEAEINQHCINQVKTIQSQWRLAGLVERNDDQRLWKTFNQACSAIYDVHRGKQKEQYDASVQHVKRAREIIKALKEAGADSNALDEKKLQQLQEEFHSLPEFPERDHKFLFRDFNRAIDGLDKQRERHSVSALQQQIQRLRNNARLCDQLEALAGQPTDAVNAQIEQLLDEWDDGEKTDNIEWKKAINLRRDSIVEHLRTGTLPDFDANTQARRLLCIDLEILLEKDTPQEDKALRMQHQLDLLQQGMTAASVESTQQQCQALEIKWLTAFPATPELQHKLNARFAAVLSA